MSKETGGPAFPSEQKHPGEVYDQFPGMDLREYAAIKLRVPDSGNDWLDAMIRTSLRNEFAAGVANGLATATAPDGTWFHGGASDVAVRAFEIADAMLAERAK